MLFVELSATREDLMGRVNNESRHKYKKLTDRAKMDAITHDLSVYSIPFIDELKINTSQLTPDESAQAIIVSLDL